MSEQAQAETTRPTPPFDDERFLDVLRQLPARRLARQIVKESRTNDLSGAAAEIAYHALFSVVPLIVSLTAVAALLNRYTDIAVRRHLLTIVFRSAPPDTAILLRSFVDAAVDQVSVGLASFSVVSALGLAIWASSNAIMSLFKALNRAYDVRETRSRLRVRLVALALAISMPTIVVLAFVLWVFGNQLGHWLTDQIGGGETFSLVWDLLRWPLAVGILLIQLALIYHVAPNVEHSSRWVILGAALATGLWFLMVLTFKLYLILVNAGTAYGAFSSVIFLLALLYFTAAIFVLGGEITAVLTRRYDVATIRHLATHPEKLANVEAVVAAREQARAYDQDAGTDYARHLPAPTSSLTRLLEEHEEDQDSDEAEDTEAGESASSGDDPRGSPVSNKA